MSRIVRSAAVLLCSFLSISALSSSAATEPALQLVETFPVETEMDHPGIPDAYEVWLEMIRGANSTLDFAEFYASNEPDSRLEDVVQAVEDAARRGVAVRFLAERRFYETYPKTLDRLGERDGIEVRILDTRELMGGVHHAKYFIVDGREAFLGSQNFDWRALTHIQELGVRIREPQLSAALLRVFDMDWLLAGGGTQNLEVQDDHEPVVMVAEGGTLKATLVASPKNWLPSGVPWDLPLIVEMMDGASETIRIQLLTYRAVGRDKTYFDTLESALRRAAARGVGVQLLLADWSKRSGTIEGLQGLEPIPGIDVKLVTIPPWSGGHIPYARVIHAKYMVVDGEKAWIGTSNWERGYFYEGRNVGLVIEGSSFCGQFDSYFLAGWDGPYAMQVDPGATYEAPRIGE
jgi:phosphatidylserine/phosphatidylglycerophosphate/cardiolipin synthase-like enzyme